MKLRENIKIACIVPIGSLTKFGYQYHWTAILENLADTFDKVYLITTTKENTALSVRIENVELIVNKTVLFDIDKDGQEIFSIYNIYAALSLGKTISKKDGFDVAINMSINMYIDKINSLKMRGYCADIIRKRKPFGYMGKAFQIDGLVTYPNTRIPAVINANYADDISYDIDILNYKKKRYGWQGGFRAGADFYAIDLLGPESRIDLHEKYDYYIKSYMLEWKGVRVDQFDYDLEKERLHKKISKLTRNKKYILDKTGVILKSKFQSNCIAKDIDFNFKSYHYLVIKRILQKIGYAIGVLQIMSKNK
jgi:hypothetical protein